MPPSSGLGLGQSFFPYRTLSCTQCCESIFSIPDPGSRGQKGTGSQIGSATLPVRVVSFFIFNRLPVITEIEPPLQRTNTENSKQIFPEKELRGHSPNFHIHVSMRVFYFPCGRSAYSAAGNMWIDLGMYRLPTDT
jgi:hypothetical protein